jgi:hypothetical protein
VIEEQLLANQSCRIFRIGDGKLGILGKLLALCEKIQNGGTVGFGRAFAHVLKEA